jgi:hypothetical protein
MMCQIHALPTELSLVFHSDRMCLYVMALNASERPQSFPIERRAGVLGQSLSHPLRQNNVL